MTNLEYCNEILSIIGNVTEANDAIYHLAYDAYLKLGGQETQPSLATIYNELKGAIQIWDNTNDLTITENGTYSLLGKVINVSVGGQPGPTPVDNRLRFESLANNSTISLSNKSASYDVLQYSLDGINWNDLTTSTPTITLNTGDLMYIKGNTNADSSSDNDYYNKFSITGRVAVKGDLVDLCGKDLNNNPHNFKYQFYNLFNNCVGLVDASNLELLNNSETAEYLYYGMFWGCSSLVSAPELPATTLASYCYARMFWGCSSLTEAPELPATSLADFCYLQMFQECTSLTEAPELPATNLAYLCYSSMFYRCSSLVSAPELPATTLTESCYSGMFGRCFSLTEAPELPATSLADGCYNLMFMECTSLIEAPELPATTLASFCYLGMFSGCSRLTSAPELPATILTDYCYNDMFWGCSSLTEAPELPATSLASYCYARMFRSCSSLTEAPELPATILTDYCYNSMFEGCSSLNKITIYANDISASNCLYNWVQYVAGSGTFYNMGIATYLVDSTSGIPIGWTENRVKPANDELWYTSTNGNIVEPSSTVLGWPLIISNTYVNGKGIIKFASNITSIAINAFYSKGTLKSIIMSDNITSIGDAAFHGCSLTTMVIPENITTIGRNVALYDTTGAFELSSLTSVVINNKMGMIGTKTFRNCTRLTNITFNGTKSQWNSITKGRNWYENVPASVVHCSDGDVTL